MVVKSHGRLFAVGGLVSGLEKGVQTGFGGADGGQNADETQHPVDPQPQAVGLVEPVGQQKKKQGGKNDGHTELTHPG